MARRVARAAARLITRIADLLPSEPSRFSHHEATRGGRPIFFATSLSRLPSVGEFVGAWCWGACATADLCDIQNYVRGACARHAANSCSRVGSLRVGRREGESGEHTTLAESAGRPKGGHPTLSGIG